MFQRRTQYEPVANASEQHILTVLRFLSTLQISPPIIIMRTCGGRSDPLETGDSVTGKIESVKSIHNDGE